MKINKKPSRSDLSTMSQATNGQISGPTPKDTGARSNADKDGFEENADKASPNVHVATSTSPPIPSIVSGTPRSAVIEMVRLEALSQRIHEVADAFARLSSEASQCGDDASIRQLFLQNQLSRRSDGPNLSETAFLEIAKLNLQLSACTIIRFSSRHTQENSNILKATMYAFKSEVAFHAPADHQKNPSVKVRKAKKRLLDDKALIDGLRPIGHDNSIAPLFDQWSNVSTAAAKTYDDALNLIREMRVLRMMAAKFA